MDLPPPTACVQQVSQSPDGTLLTLCAVAHRLRRPASGPATPTTQEAPDRERLHACVRLLHGRRVRHGTFPCASRQQGNAPLGRDRDVCFEREVRPRVPDAWMDRSKGKVGYETNFHRHFYKYTPRWLEEIDADLKKAEEEIVRLLGEVTG